MEGSVADYLILLCVLALLGLCGANLYFTIKEYKREGYFQGGGPYGNTNVGMGGYGTKEGYFSGAGPYGNTNTGSGSFHSGKRD